MLRLSSASRHSRVIATSSALLAIAGLTLAASPAQAVVVFALNTANQLYSFDSGAPGVASLIGTIDLGGTGATALGIDVRQDGTLYALGSNGNIYTLNGATGTQFSTAAAPAISGTDYTIDFNPVPNALRIINRSGQNLRVANTAGTTNLSTLNTDGSYPANVAVVGTSYTNTDTNPATGTQQYVIDDNTDSLILVNLPNSPGDTGGLTTRGPLGVAVSGPVGFDIYFDGLVNTGYLAVGSDFYTVNLATGQASAATAITGPTGAGIGTVRGLSAQVIAAPEPGTIALLLSAGVPLAGLVRRRRK